MAPRTTITLHRGADTIGGSCIRVTHGDDSIVLDYGMPLMGPGGAPLEPGSAEKPCVENDILLDICSGEQRPLAFIISHAHPDHYGLVDYVPADIPVYLSEASKRLIRVGNVFYPEPMRVRRVAGCPTYKPGKAFSIGPFKITAFLMDHSAFGACSILVEVGGKRVFYTGDFRGHGRKSSVNEHVIRAVQGSDVMLMEGTTLDDGHPAIFPDEQSVEDEVVRLIQERNAPVFVAGSGSNIDRIVSLYRAAKRTGRKLVIDLYQAYLLDQLKEFSQGLPPHQGDHLRVYYPHAQRNTVVSQLGDDVLRRYHSRHINKAKIDFTSPEYIFRISNYFTRTFALEFVASGMPPHLVYSMWQGYRDQQPVFGKISELTGSDWKYIHTSGHAYTHTLRKFAEDIRPKRLVPVHTLRGDDFSNHFQRVIRLDNGATLDI